MAVSGPSTWRNKRNNSFTNLVRRCWRSLTSPAVPWPKIREFSATWGAASVVGKEASGLAEEYSVSLDGALCIVSKGITGWDDGDRLLSALQNALTALAEKNVPPGADEVERAILVVARELHGRLSNPLLQRRSSPSLPGSPRASQNAMLSLMFLQAGRITITSFNRGPVMLLRHGLLHRISERKHGTAAKSIFHLPAREGDRLLLATDGVTDELSQVRIASFLLRYERPQEAVQRLIEAAEKGGSCRSRTAVVVDLHQLQRVEQPAEESVQLAYGFIV